MKNLIKNSSAFISISLSLALSGSSLFAMDTSKDDSHIKQYAEYYTFEGKNIINPGQEVMNEAQFAEATYSRLNEIVEIHCDKRRLEELKSHDTKKIDNEDIVTAGFETKNQQHIQTCEKIHALVSKMAIIKTYNEYECNYLLKGSSEFTVKSQPEQDKSFTACVNGPQELSQSAVVAGLFRKSDKQGRGPASIITKLEDEVKPLTQFTEYFEAEDGISSAPIN